jgi:hypothetical protein
MNFSWLSWLKSCASLIRFGIILGILLPGCIGVVMWTDLEYARSNTVNSAFSRACRAFVDVVPLLCFSSLCLAVGSSWHHWRRGWIAPGRLVIILGSVLFVVQIVRIVLWSWLASWQGLSSLWYLTGNGTALAIIGGWTLLAVVGARRSKYDTADLLGRILGWCWLAATVSYWSMWAAFS